MYKFNIIKVHHYLYFARLLPAVELVILDDEIETLRVATDDTLLSLSALCNVFCLDGLVFGEDFAPAGVHVSLELPVAGLLATESIAFGTTNVGGFSTSVATSSSKFCSFSLSLLFALALADELFTRKGHLGGPVICIRAKTNAKNQNATEAIAIFVPNSNSHLSPHSIVALSSKDSMPCFSDRLQNSFCKMINVSAWKRQHKR